MWHSFQTIFAGDFYALRALNKDFSMGKPTLHPNVQGTTTNRRTRTAALILLSCCLIFACLLGFKWTRPVLSALCESQGTPPENELNTARGLNPEDKPWSDLIYRPCHDGYQCARLLVPMDWNDVDATNNNVAIAVVRLPAKVKITDPRYGGAVIVNPGGPGNSGVASVLASGRHLQDTVDSTQVPDPMESDDSGNKHFDIISFDPRGVNHSTPRIECFQSSSTRLVWELRNLGELLGSPGTAVSARWATFESLSKACMQRVHLEGDRSIAYHLNTTPVARDVIELSERHGQWRQCQARKWLSSIAGLEVTRGRSLSDPHNEQAVLQRTLWRAGKEMLQYYGESYGATTGQYLAAAYPEKMHRTVFDSAPLATASGRTGFVPSELEDADKVIASFCAYCHAAGPLKCPLYRDTARHVCGAIENVFASLYEAPLAVPASEQRGPAVVDYPDLKRSFGRAVYDPIGTFPGWALIFQDLAQGNGSSFADWKSASQDLQFADSNYWSASKACIDEGPFSGACQNVDQRQIEVEGSVFCTDYEGAADMDKAEFVEYWTSMREQSRVLGDIFSEYLLRCVGWDIQAKWRRKGPFTGQTKHPILLVNNRFDPVTPMRDANAVSNNFNGSAVLIQNTVGHLSRYTKSACTSTIIRRYFQTGELPANGTVCEVDEHPFGVLTALNLATYDLDVSESA